MNNHEIQHIMLSLIIFFFVCVCVCVRVFFWGGGGGEWGIFPLYEALHTVNLLVVTELFQFQVLF